MRSVQAAVVFHVDDCAVIGAKRLADVKRSRTLRADQYPVTSSSSLHLPAEAVAFDLDAYAVHDQACSGRAYAGLHRRLALKPQAHAGLHLIAEEDSPAAGRLGRWLDTLFAAKRRTAGADPELLATLLVLMAEKTGRSSGTSRR